MMRFKDRLLILMISILMVPFPSQGNGAPPWAILTEFSVDSNGNWIMELEFHQYNYIDSIVVQSTTGSATVSHYTLIPPDLTLLSDTNLLGTVNFNPEGDRVTVISYGSGYQYTNILPYGNAPYSYLGCANAGDSYAFIECPSGLGNGWTWSIDKTPTFGMENDYDGIFTVVTGVVYDPEGEPFSGGWFEFALDDLIISINSDGSYNRQLYQRNYYCEQITINTDTSTTSYAIVPWDICIRSYNVIEKDFITTSLVGNQEIRKNTGPEFTVVPNPFSSSVRFYWSDDIFDNYGKLELTIHSPGGKRIFREVLLPGSQRLIWKPGEELPPGMYIYHITSGREFVTSGKIIKL